MMHEICRSINYLAESVALLEHIAKGTSFAELKNSLCLKRGITFETKKGVFEVLYKIEDEAKEAFAAEKEQVEYYFRVEENRSGSCGKAIVLWDYFDSPPFKDGDSLEKYIEGLSQESYSDMFGIYLQGYLDNLHDTSNFLHFREPLEVISYLTNLEISSDEKMKLQTVYLNKEEHLPKVMALLFKAESFLKHYKEELEHIVEDFYRYWSKTLSDISFGEYIRRRVHIELPENPLGYHLRPSILLPNALGVHVDITGEGEPKPDEGFIGVLYGEELEIFFGEEDSEEKLRANTLQVLKLLSDKSKFEILSYISDKSAYGSQLAKQMNLTTATISHHMGALMAEGLVFFEQRENRIYYRLNKEALEMVLNYCRDIFLQK